MALVDREIGMRGSLMDFVQLAWPLVVPHSPFVDGWHLHEIAHHLEACDAGEIRRLIINVPPGMSKSSLVSVFWPMRSWIRQPERAFLRGSFDQGLGERDAQFCGEMFESEWWKDRWGDRFEIPGDWGKSNFVNDRGGRMVATAPGGKGLGQHFNVHILDDPTKAMELTDIALEAVLNWRKSTLANRWRDAKGVEVIIMQRLHERDLSGVLERMGKHVVLRLPMRFESKYACTTKWGGDRRTEEGQLLCPERIDEDELALKQADMGGADSMEVAAQHQQRPTPAGGAIFKSEWFQTWSKDPMDPRDALLPEHFDQVIQSWDCTFKDTKTSDFVVGQVWGRKGTDYFLLDQFRERTNLAGTVAAIKAMAGKWPRATRILIEDKANGPAVIDTLTDRKTGLPGIEAVNPPGRQGGAGQCCGAVLPEQALCSTRPSRDTAGS